MKSTHSKGTLERTLDSGWTVHVYNRQRQLLCTLTPSHGWSFVAGTVTGILLAVIGFNLSTPQMVNSLPEETAPQTAPLQVD
jgi:hypothetical protein